MSFPYMRGESARVRWLAAQTPRLRRLVLEQAQIDAAGKISKALDVLLSALGFVAGVTVGAWATGDWEITVGQMWTAVVIVAVVVGVRVAWLRYRFRRIVRKVNREMEIDHPWPDSK